MASPFVRNSFWVLLAAGAVFFIDLGGTRLWDEDETLYASISRDMLERDDWVVPCFNGHLFPEKPPIMFWSIGAGFELFGETEFAARFAAAVYGAAGAWVTYLLGRRIFNERAGLWAGLIAASTIIYTISARVATVDAALTLSTALAMLGFAVGLGLGRSEPPRPAARWTAFALGYAALGVAVLCKGPIGFLLPAAGLGLFLWIKSGLYLPFVAFWRMRPITAALVVLAVALPWYWLVSVRTDGEWIRGFFAKFNWRPFSQPFLGHSGPFWYHVPAILIGFFPWSVFLGNSLAETYRAIRRRDPARDGLWFCVAWFAIFFVFWSICSTKLPHYTLPAYPALALLTGYFLDRWLGDPSVNSRRSAISAALTLVAVGLAIAVAMPIACSYFLPGEDLLALTGVPLILGGIACFVAMRRGHIDRGLVAFAVTAVVFLVGIFSFGARGVARHQDVPPLLDAIRSDCQAGEQPQLAAFRYFRQSMVFYSHQTVLHRNEPAELEAFLAQSPHPYMFTLDVHAKELEDHFPDQLRKVAEHRRFLHYNKGVVHQLIVLGKKQTQERAQP